jgi:hypothetical protein
VIVYYYRELEDQIVAKEDDCYFMNTFMNRSTETNKQTVTVIWYYYYLFDGTNK